jgi:citrate lyase subunit beta/citryl-CoA lyase
VAARPDGLTAVTTTLTALYVPASRPERFVKAIASGADTVIIDLEDSVAPAEKDAARRALVGFLSPDLPVPIVVRINGRGTPWHTDDLAAARGCSGMLAGIRVPKVDHPDDLTAISDVLGDMPLHPVIESARGVLNLAAIAGAAQVASISIGEADLRSDLAVSAPDGLDGIRDQLVVTARAAGLPQPMMSVWTAVKDLDGLARSCADGKAHGYLGRSAIHPAQIPVIRRAFAPEPAEIDRARAVLRALDQAERRGDGVALLPDGSMVDAAMRHGAERTVELAARAEAEGWGAAG